MSYYDGFLAAVPRANKDRYLEHAKEAATILKDLGAEEVMEFWGDDIPEGKVNSMHTAVMREPDEEVVMSVVRWTDKAVRDKAYAAMRDDPRMRDMDMPFDGKRMIYGGFVRLL